MVKMRPQMPFWLGATFELFDDPSNGGGGAESSGYGSGASLGDASGSASGITGGGVSSINAGAGSGDPADADLAAEPTTSML